MYWSVLSVAFIIITVEILTQTRIPAEPLGPFIQDTVTKFLFPLILLVVMSYSALYSLYMNIKVLVTAGHAGYVQSQAPISQNLRQRWLPIIGLIAAIIIDSLGFFPPHQVLSVHIGSILPIVLILIQLYLFVF